MPPGRDQKGRFTSGPGSGPKLEATISGDTSEFIAACKRGARELITFQKDLTRVSVEINDAFNQAAKGGRLFSDAANAAASKAGSAFARMQRTGNEAAVAIGRSFKSVGEGLTRMSFTAVGKLVDMLERLAIVGTAAGVALGAAAIGATAKWARFESQFARVTTIVDKGTVDTQQLSDAVRGLARAYGVDAVEAVGALAEAIGSGIDPAEAMTFLETATKAATAGFADLGSVVTVFTGLLASYNLEAKDAARVSDVLFQAVKVGRTTMDQLAGSLGQVAPVAAAAGVSLEETAAAVAALTVRGLSTAEAVSALRAIITGIIKPAEQAVDGLEAIGATAAELQRVGLAEIMQRVAKETNGSSAEIGKLFRDVDALKGVVVLAGGGLDDFTNALGTMQDAAGSTDAALAEVMNTLQFRWNQVTETVADTIREVGAMLAPFASALLEPILAFATRTAEEVRAVGRMFKEETSGIVALVKAMGVSLNVEGGAITSSLGLISTAMREVGLLTREAAPYLAFFATAAESAALAIEVAFDSVMIAVRSTGGVLMQVLQIVAEGIGIYAEMFGAEGLQADMRAVSVSLQKHMNSNAAAVDRLKDSAGDAAMELVDFERRFLETAGAVERFGDQLRLRAGDVEKLSDAVRDNVNAHEENQAALDILNGKTQEAATVTAGLTAKVVEATAAQTQLAAATGELETFLAEWAAEIKAAGDASERTTASTNRLTGAMRQQRVEVLSASDAWKQYVNSFRLLGGPGPPIRLKEDGFNGVGTPEQREAARRAAAERANSAGRSLLGFQPRGSGLSITPTHSGGSSSFGIGASGLIGFATGGPVPRDMIAQVHQREFVLPSAAARAIGPYGLEMLRNLRPSVNMPMTINITTDSRAPDLREQARVLLPEITRAARLGIGAGGPF